MGWSLPANPIPKKIQRRLEYILKVATVKTFRIEIAMLVIAIIAIVIDLLTFLIK